MQDKELREQVDLLRTNISNWLGKEIYKNIEMNSLKSLNFEWEKALVQKQIQSLYDLFWGLVDHFGLERDPSDFHGIKARFVKKKKCTCLNGKSK